jgi:D-glycerate 3-kinase
LASVVDNLNIFLERECLPDSYREQAQNSFIPFVESLRPLLGVQKRVPVLGIHGSQGSGKSTLAEFMYWYLHEGDGLNIALLSLDDFYLTLAQRQQLASSIHPLLRTRGVPGTHDVSLALATIAKLRSLRSDQVLRLPRFDKARDDRSPQSSWPKVRGPIDLIVFEGWCVGASPQMPTELESAINDLEQCEDADSEWRRYVNTCLAGDYQTLFAELDYLLMLRAPSFHCVADWRGEQEQKLAQRQQSGASTPGLMDSAAIQRFIQHYERLTTHCLNTLPASADCVMSLGSHREILTVQYREGK